MRQLALLPMLLLVASAAVEPVPWVADGDPAAAGQGVSFADLLAEGGLVFEPPVGLAEVPVAPNELFPYEHGRRNADGTLEVRYAVRPLGRLKVEYEDPHSSAPDPNHVFPLVFQSLLTRLSGGGHSPSREYPPEQAREKWNADWAAATVLTAVGDFDSRRREVLFIAIHKNRKADAYAAFLFDDYVTVKDDINAALTALRFEP